MRLTPIARKLVTIRKQLESQSYIKFMAFQLLLNFATGLLFFALSVLYAIISNMEIPEVQGFSKPIRHILTILPIGIIIETLLFQFIPYHLFRFYWHIRKQKSPLSYIIISALLFGFYHLKMSGDDITISILKVFTTVLAGMVLSTSYYILARKKQFPFWSVFLNHFIYDIVIIGLIIITV